MRWRIRTQLLLPVVVLLAGVAGISITTAAAATRQARRQIESRLRNVARFLVEEAPFQLNESILRKLRPLSGADFLLEPPSGALRTSLEIEPGEAPHDPPGARPVVEDWRALHLGPPVRIHGQTYLCSGIRLRQWPNTGDTL